MSDYGKYETIKVEKANRVATVTLNRPDSLNAVNPVLHRELPDGRALGGVDPVRRDAFGLGVADDLGIPRVEEHRELRVQQALGVGRGRRLGDAIGVVQDNADVADPPHTGL